jgi:hypothetical protein
MLVNSKIKHFIIVSAIKFDFKIQYDGGIDRLEVVVREGSNEKVIWSLAYFDAAEHDVWLPAQVEIVPEQSEQDYIVSYSKVF